MTGKSIANGDGCRQLETGRNPLAGVLQAVRAAGLAPPEFTWPHLDGAVTELRSTPPPDPLEIRSARPDPLRPARSETDTHAPLTGVAGNSQDLLPALVAAWSGTGHTHQKRFHCRRVWAEEALHYHAQLTLGLPRATGQMFESWLGKRLCWWPYGMPATRLVGLASSRLGRAVAERDDWFRVLRTCCETVETASERLLIGTGTAPGPYAMRAAELFGVPATELRVAASDHTLGGWLKAIAAWQWHRPALMVEQLTAIVPQHRWTDSSLSGLRQPHGPAGVCLVSPPLASAQRCSDLADVAERDCAVCAMADELRVLHIRPHGSIHKLVGARLRQHAQAAGSVRIAVGPRLVAEPVRDELLGQGAVGWACLDHPASQPITAAGKCHGAVTARYAHVASHVTHDRDYAEFLTHCTRRRDGPWPGQSESAYLDELIMSPDVVDRSPLAVLRRILATMRLVASTDGIRGGHAVVSFTDVPLPAVHRMRVFRPHRGRWDFQPYGLAVRRDWLLSRGARPVSYAPSAAWDDMAAGDRPFFQLHCSVTARGREMCWTAEHEWRHVGDVDLSELPREDALVFVPTAEEAAALAMISRWPVIDQKEVSQKGVKSKRGQEPFLKKGS